MQAIILAGGFGTRLRTLSGTLPKSLVPIAGHPILHRQLEQLVRGGCETILILTGHAGDQIAEYCGDGSKWGARIHCLQEPTARGTAGAVLDAWEALDDRFLVIYADTVFDVDLPRMMTFHRERSAEITLFIHSSDHPNDSDLVNAGPGDRLWGFHPYPHAKDLDICPLSTAGLYVIEKTALARCQGLPEKPDFVKHLFPLLLARGVRFFGYRSPEYIKDAGTPERFQKVERDLLEGLPETKSLTRAGGGVLLDRDGTIIEERGHLSKPEEVMLLPGATEAIERLNRSSWRTVVITNQPVIARGECDEAGMDRIHKRMENLLGTGHAHIDRIYYCPHHPARGFPSERTELKMRCSCRKPEIGMVEKAERELNLNLPGSWLIGDSSTDLLTARRAGLRSILVKTGFGGRDGRLPCLPDYECRDLGDAVDLILEQWPRLNRQIRAMDFKIAANSVFLVGGLARSGKSTVSAVLAEVIRESGLQAAVVPLDCFLRGVNQNRGANVLDRYDIEAAMRFVRDALVRPGLKRLARYDRVLRQSIPDGVEIEIPCAPVLILEGVPALAHPELRRIAADSLYVTRPERDRLQAIQLDYRGRGWQDSQISELIASRAADEVPVIESSKPYAGAHLSL